MISMAAKKVVYPLLVVLCFIMSGLCIYAFFWACTNTILNLFMRVLSASSFVISIATLVYLSAYFYEKRKSELLG